MKYTQVTHTTSMNHHYPVRAAWDETHTVERSAIRHARIMRRKNIVENIKWSFILFAMGLAVVFAPMVNYIF